MIVEVEVIQDILEPKYQGCGAYEYCLEHNEFYVAHKKGEKYFVDIDQEAKTFDNTSKEIMCLFDKRFAQRFATVRCYKTYTDIILDREAGTKYRRKGSLIDSTYLSFVRTMPLKTIPVNGVSYTI